MRRFRVPTIPNMGMSISQREGEPLQACDSAIFADAEEESPCPEKRPSAPHFSGLRRRNTNHEQSRFMDASQVENQIEKRPSATMRFKTLKSLSSGKEVHAGDTKECNKPQVTMVQNLTEKGHDSRSPLENEKKYFQESEVTSTSGVVEPSLHPQRDGSCQKTSSCQLDQQSTAQMNHTVHTENESSNEVAITVTHATQVRHVDVLNPFRKAAEKVRTLYHHLSQHTIPRLRQRTSVGFALIITNVSLVFNFLRWCFEHLFHLLAAIKVKRIRRATGTNEALVPAGITKESSSIPHPDICSRATDAEEGVREQLCFDKTNVSTDVSSKGINLPQNKRETLCSAYNSHNSIRSNSELRYPPAPTQGKNLGTLSSDMTEEMMTAVPQIPSIDRTSDCLLREDKIAYKGENKTHIHQHHEGEDSERKIESQSITDGNPQLRLSTNVATSEPSTETLSQGRNSAEDLMNELDRSSMRFERRESEIIISPLDPASPAFFSDEEFDTEKRRRIKYPSGEVKVLQNPARLSTEMHQLGRSTGKKRNSRGPTGKLKTDVRTMKDSIFRVFGRNKTEPETRFASPRSARKTMALIADMLVKEHGCDVAVRRNGALKMRCEKTFTGNQRLKVRLAFQPMDAYSCNVIICRSRDDELHVSTTDYVGFVADVQRSFLNATSEGMLGTGGGN